MNQVKIFDTTLRDGTQGEGISLTVEDKLKIARKLDELGVHYIEGGWPGSNYKDIEFFSRVKELPLKHAKISAFGSTRRKGIPAAEDINLNRIIETGVTAASIFGKSWDFHVETAIQTSLEENLAMIADSVSYLKSHGLEVIFLAEHFFDGFKHNEEYAVQTVLAAEAAGADCVVLCDTNGGTLPEGIAAAVGRVCRELKITVGIHAHNDCELGVANTLAAVSAGARHVQGTFNGLGERCGNANLCSVIPNLQLKMNYRCISGEQLAGLTGAARFISEVANIHVSPNQPFVGASAFAHKGGIHVSAILKASSTYEHIAPELVGNKQRVLVSELAGQSNLLAKAQDLNLDVTRQTEKTKAVIEQIKTLEHQGYQFEGADASLELLLREAFGELEHIFSLESFKLLVEKSGDNPSLSEAFVKVRVHGEAIFTAAEGNGPVNALDNALRKALVKYYPDIAHMHLADYKVRVIDEKDATAAKVRVLIESTDFKSNWSTVGVSDNIIEASWHALVDSIRYWLIGKERSAIAGETPIGNGGLVNH